MRGVKAMRFQRITVSLIGSITPSRLLTLRGTAINHLDEALEWPTRRGSAHIDHDLGGRALALPSNQDGGFGIGIFIPALMRQKTDVFMGPKQVINLLRFLRGPRKNGHSPTTREGLADESAHDLAAGTTIALLQEVEINPRHGPRACVPGQAGIERAAAPDALSPPSCFPYATRFRQCPNAPISNPWQSARESTRR